jgi:hypothetical protein
MWGHHHNNPWYFEYFEETKDIDISEFKNECKNHSIQKENTHYTNQNVFNPFNEFDWVREKYNYASRIAQHFGVEFINESIFGGSLDRLYRKTINYIINSDSEDLKNTLFILEIPPMGRNEMYFTNQNRYCNFTSGNDNFDFINDDNFEFIKKYNDKCLDVEVIAKNELSKIYTLIQLFESKGISYIFIQTDDRFTAIPKQSNKYIEYKNARKIQQKINNHSVQFILNNQNQPDYYDIASWIRESKSTFRDHTNGFSFDGHNSIDGSKKIAEQIINYINLQI